jgi:hypothetical protein
VDIEVSQAAMNQRFEPKRNWPALQHFIPVQLVVRQSSPKLRNSPCHPLAQQLQGVFYLQRGTTEDER